jgi:RNA polymerase sigma factor (sigma-70 family)
VGRNRFQGSPLDLRAAGAWLRGIAWNLHCSARRGAARNPGPLDPAETAPLPEVDERREALIAAFAVLDPRHQTVLRMAYLEDSSTIEVAALLGVTQTSAENRLYQARRALREIVDRQAASQESGART